MSTTVTVAVNGDTAVEPDEAFSLGLANPLPAVIGDGSAIGLIRNDDIAPPSRR